MKIQYIGISDTLLEMVKTIKQADYDRNDTITEDFFATTRNKLHWAIQGKTAAEIIYSETDAKKTLWA